MSIPDSRICNKCNQTKSLSEFVPNKDCKWGVRPVCKACRNQGVKARFAANPELREARLQYGADWWAENRERQKVYRKGYRAKRLDRLKENDRRLYQKNREARRAKARQWHQDLKGDPTYQQKRKDYQACYRREHPERARTRVMNYRARKKGALGSFTAKEFASKLAAYENKCHWCGELITGPVHRDHLVPLSRGGTNYIENIVPSCQTCNLTKSGKLPEEFLEYVESNRRPSEVSRSRGMVQAKSADDEGKVA